MFAVSDTILHATPPAPHTAVDINRVTISNSLNLEHDDQNTTPTTTATLSSMTPKRQPCDGCSDDCTKCSSAPAPHDMEDLGNRGLFCNCFLFFFLSFFLFFLDYLSQLLTQQQLL